MTIVKATLGLLFAFEAFPAVRCIFSLLSPPCRRTRTGEKDATAIRARAFSLYLEPKTLHLLKCSSIIQILNLRQSRVRDSRKHRVQPIARPKGTPKNFSDISLSTLASLRSAKASGRHFTFHFCFARSLSLGSHFTFQFQLSTFYLPLHFQT